MRRLETDPAERGGWTPFVGAALAALAAGSLVVFSFVAQRTSLEGFSSQGVTAVSPSGSAPRSITLPDGDTGDSGAIAATGSKEEPDATALSALSPTSVTITALDEAFAPGAPTADVADAGDSPAASTPDDDAGDTTAFADFAGGDEGEIFYRDGEGRAAALDWRRAGHGRDNATAKGRATGKAKAHKRNGKRGHPAPKARRHGRSSRGRHKHHAAAVRHRPYHRSSAAPAAPSRRAHSSRPASAPQPQRASAGRSKNPPGHSNAGGKSHSKGRAHGRGRGRGRGH